jgi:hypothetical protein
MKLDNRKISEVKRAVIIFFCILIFNQSSLVSAAGNSATIFNSGLSKTGPDAGYTTMELKDAKSKLTGRISSIILIFLNFLGVLFLALMIYGGYVWMTARGEESRYQKAKDILIQATIGLILISSAYAISYFVIEFLVTKT